MFEKIDSSLFCFDKSFIIMIIISYQSEEIFIFVKFVKLYHGPQWPQPRRCFDNTDQIKLFINLKE